ncbi:MAG TPA: ABC transporter permease [Phototrophicaceae bacterium]|nr:ABC transporter permease [Phototrophicaceae bacterium]
MDIVETLRVALVALSTNRLRAMLTTLGIMIGVASVVALMSLGGSLQAYIQDQFLSLGADTLQISSSRNRFTATGTQPLTTTDADGIMAAAPDVKEVGYTYSLQAPIVYNQKSDNLSIQGVTPNYTDINNWEPMPGGRFITQADMDNAARVALIDPQTATDLFGTANPVGQTVLIKDQVFTIIGEMTTKSTGFSNQTVLIPATTAQTRLANARVAGKGYRVSQIQAKAAAADSPTITAATNEITAYLLRQHGIRTATAADFTVFSQATILDSLSSTLGLLTIFLSAIAGISLLVGGIGVMNIMLVSVTERTREIGLRKAVGAQASTILTQFLLESILLSLLGGAIGIALGGLVLVIGGRLAPQLPIALTPISTVLATGISTLIGVLSGLYPARRAAMMAPIQALRFE